jgi:hypothetical protein
MNLSWHTGTLFCYFPLPLFWNSMENVRCRGHSQWWETLHWIQNLFSSKIVFIKTTTYGIANKISFYAKEPYSLSLKPHVAIIGFAWGGTLSTLLCTHRIAFVDYSEHHEEGEEYDYYDDAEEWGLVDYIDCLWLDGVTSHLYFRWAFWL